MLYDFRLKLNVTGSTYIVESVDLTVASLIVLCSLDGD